MKKHPKHFYMLNLGPYPVTAVYAPNERAYKRVIKKYGISSEVDDGTYPDAAGNVTTFHPDLVSCGNTVCIVTLDLNADVKNEQFCAMVAHECTHVFQHLCEAIGEKHPSSEFMAYTIQSLTQDVLFAISDFNAEVAKRNPQQ